MSVETNEANTGILREPPENLVLFVRLGHHTEFRSDAAGLQHLITAAGWVDRVEPAVVGQEGVAVIHRVTAPEIGARAFAAGLELHELVPRDVGLEGIFLRLVGDDVGAEVAEPHREGGVAR